MFNKKFNIFFKMISVTVAVIFLWNQIVWAADITDTIPLSTTTIMDPVEPQVVDSTLESLVSHKQMISDFILYNTSLSETPSESLEPGISLSVIGANGEIIRYENGELKEIERTDGSIIKNMVFDEQNALIDADIVYPDNRIMVIRAGIVNSITDVTGVQFNYDDQGDIITVEYPDGKEESYTYEKDAVGNVTRTIVTDNEKFIYYDENSVLYRVEYFNGKTVECSDGVVSRIIEMDGTVYRYENREGEAVLKEIEQGGNIYYVEDGNISSVRLVDGTMMNDIVLDTRGNITDVVMEYIDGTKHMISEGRLAVSERSDGTVSTYTYVMDDLGGIASCQVTVVSGETIKEINYIKDLVTGKITVEEKGNSYFYEDDWTLEEIFDGENTYTYVYDAEGVYKGTTVGTVDGTIGEYDAEGFLKKAIFPDDEVSRYEYSVTDSGVLKVLQRSLYNKTRIYPQYCGTSYIDRSTDPRFKTVFNLENSDNGSYVVLGLTYYQSGDRYVNFTTTISGTGISLKYREYDYQTYQSDRICEELDLEIRDNTFYIAEYVWQDDGVGVYIYEEGEERPETALYILEDNEGDPMFNVGGLDLDVSIDPSSDGVYLYSKTMEPDHNDLMIGSAIHRTEVFFDSDVSWKSLQYYLSAESTYGVHSIDLMYYAGSVSLMVCNYCRETGINETEYPPLDITIEEDTVYVLEMRNENNNVSFYIYEKGSERGEAEYVFENISMDPQIYTFINGGDIDVEAWSDLETYEYDADTGNLLSCVRSSEGETITYEYDNNGELLHKTILFSDNVKNIYDARDRLILEENTMGEITIYEYDEQGTNYIYPKFPGGSMFTYYTTGEFAGKLEKVVLPEGEVVYYTYKINEENDLVIYGRNMYDQTEVYNNYTGNNYIDYTTNPSFKTSFSLDENKSYNTFFADVSSDFLSDKIINLSVNVCYQNPLVCYYCK
ncbi:MAG: RHS repeat protein, partial [Candidatus Omnitrophica bacterium]|nr:RHS repeat protein [Candidatus Omnitrophota bacterium]